MATFKVLVLMILWITSIFNVRCEKFVTIPVNCSGEVDIDKMDVMCPNRYNLLSTNHLMEGEEVETFCRPSLRENDLLDGYLCRKQKWEVTCTETWYFVTDVKYQIIEVIPTENECMEERERKLKGEYIPPYYPPTNCVWNAIDTQERTFITLIEHPVIEDPVTMTLMDSKFTKPCNPKHNEVTICDTYNPLIKWISKETSGLNLHCQIKSWECIPVKLHHSHRNMMEALYLESPDFGIVDASKICNLTFCGYNGILLDNGEWWSIYRSGFTHGFLDNHILKNRRIEECKEKKPGYKLAKLDTTYIDLEFEIELEHEKCLGTLEKLQNGEYVTPLDLSYLSPSNPGKHYAYRLEYINTTEHKCVQLGFTYEGGDCRKMLDERDDHGAYYNWTTIKLQRVIRAVCYYHTFSMNLDESKHKYYDQDNRSIQIDEKFISEVLKSTPLIDRHEKYEGNLSWNGIIIESKNGHEKNVIVPSASQYNHVMINKILKRLDTVMYDSYKFDSESGSISYNKIVPIVREDNLQNAHRVDVIQYIKDKGSYIINGFTGWFSSLGKLMRWTIWGVGLFFSIFTLYKIIMILRKHSNDNVRKEFKETAGKVMIGQPIDTKSMSRTSIKANNKGKFDKVKDLFTPRSKTISHLTTDTLKEHTDGTYEELHFFNV
ncbi:virion transmembrane glycoprotein [Adelaide River virus]|uniref:Glycoprotein n=2 Tax=Adelaide River virus TaxID=31612 RepID=GLYCO_ARV|nr:virion transmembrane glycoprotein [Adelaide River virus]Q89669.1 RecName: Full=Glycoprotein; Flags: Precursor [Adelaide River virus]AAA02762.1 ARV G protein [Adelaide River virus]AAA02764.1 ARV G protein [Adelaide River virus]AFR23535.1 virion transmembrane glycoprotein [Adelaide River virus]